MSPFKEQLDHAKAKQRVTYLLAFSGIVIVLGAIIIFIMASNGTRVIIGPEDAAELAEMSVSRGVAIKGSVYSLSSTPTLSINAHGFKPVVQTIPPAHIGKTHEVEMLPLPGILKFSTNEPSQKTKWDIDDQNVAISAELNQVVEAGPHRVKINHPYFTPYEMDMEIRRGETILKAIALDPIIGSLQIDSRPSADIYVNGEQVGQTPAVIEKPGGVYQIELRKDNYLTLNDELEITNKQLSPSRTYILEEKKSYIRVSVSPSNGTLLLDGKAVLPNQPIEVSVVQPHSLSYSKAGFYGQSMEVFLKEGETQEVSFDLKAELGGVEILSTPEAEVWINGRPKGMTPMTTRLSAVAHRIEIKKAGYRSVKKTVKPKANATQRISVALMTELAARRNEAKDRYKNPVGGEMLLFKPNEPFTLGAARSEKGQRANEFLREVKLTKDFYAGVHEVTNAQYGKFDRSKATGPSNEPVSSVGWHEAAAFCNWLSQKEKLIPFYTIQSDVVVGYNPNSDGYRLLSEAEWEWLARKAKKKKRTIFTWGNDTVIPPKAANIADETANGTVKFYVPQYTDGFLSKAPVGSFNQEKSGLYDMAGNVSEWVHDSYSIVPPSGKTVEQNPLGAQRGSSFVVKGANFRSGTLSELRPSYREGLVGGRDDVGFRVGRYLWGGERG